jgi:hypothetical protein
MMQELQIAKRRRKAVSPGAGASRRPSVLLPAAPALHDTRPAEGILWRCAHRALSAGDLDELHDAGLRLGKADWDELATLARDNGIEGLVLHQAAAADLLPAMPEHVSQALLTAYRAAWLHNRRLRGHLARIIQALDARGIEVMPIKGVVLAERCYGELALRPITDLDLLVHRADLPVIGQNLVQLGFQPLHGESDPLAFRGLVYHAVAYSGPDGALVELHWQLANLPAYLPRMEADDLWRRARRIEFAGQLVWALAPGDELRYLCFHCTAQHQSTRLIWLVDIAELVRALPAEWNWQAFVDETITSGLATPVAVALERARSLLGLPLPGGVLEALWQASRSRRETAAWSSAPVMFRRPDSLLRYLLVQSSTHERLLLLRALAGRAQRRWRREVGAALDRCMAWLAARLAPSGPGTSARRAETVSGQPIGSSLDLGER